MNKIEIKSTKGEVLFMHKCKNNNFKTTLTEAVRQGTDLQYAKLQYAKLQYAKLQGADLQGADLRRANLRGTDLWDANLQGANLDYSCLHLSCQSLKPRTDERQRIQLTYHLLSWIKESDNATEFEKELFEFAKDYANRFHRTDVEKF